MTRPSDSVDVLTRKDIDEMVAATDNPRDEALITFQFEVGLCPPELTNLQIRQLKPVIEGRGFVVVVHAKARSRTVRVIESGGSLKRWLELHPASDCAESAVWTHNSPPYSLSSSTIQMIFDRTAAQAGIEKRATPYAVRHACARRLQEIGMPSQYICIWLGLSYEGILPPPSSAEVNQWYEHKWEEENE